MPRKDMVTRQSIKIVMKRVAWQEFRQNCVDNGLQPLATLRDWIDQYNEHCEAKNSETPAD